MTSKCLSLEVLAALLDNSLTPNERDEAERHLAECQDCRETLRLAVSTDDTPDNQSNNPVE